MMWKTNVVLVSLLLSCSSPDKEQHSSNPENTRAHGAARGVAAVAAESSADTESLTINSPALQPMKVGGEVSAPRVISRVVPTPAGIDPKQCYELGIASFEAVIDKRGHIQSVKQTAGPQNEFSKASGEALKQWKFEPGKYRGQPVDVIFNFMINHVPQKKVDGPC
jgi:hypothetical protein